jgi:hypothetical protein
MTQYIGVFQHSGDCPIDTPDCSGLDYLVPAYNDTMQTMTDDERYDRYITVLRGRYSAFDTGLTGGTITIHKVTTLGMANKTFRNAWEWEVDKIQVNMTKARTIHMDRIRTVRNASLVDTDVPFRKAVETWLKSGTNADKQSAVDIATNAQTLRDIPATFDITTDVATPDQLDAKWPAELPDR